MVYARYCICGKCLFLRNPLATKEELDRLWYREHPKVSYNHQPCDRSAFFSIKRRRTLGAVRHSLDKRSAKLQKED